MVSARLLLVPALSGESSLPAQYTEIPLDTDALIAECLAIFPDGPSVPESAPMHARAPANERDYDLVADPSVPIVPGPRSRVATARTRMQRRTARWPVLLCAMVAIASGGQAVLMSPLGQTPALQRIVAGATLGESVVRRGIDELRTLSTSAR